MKKTFKLPVSATPDKRICVIGDVHGEYHLFRKALKSIREPSEVTLILLGDFIDRGPDSDLVLKRLHVLPEVFKEVVILPGNHEQMLWFGQKEDSWWNVFLMNGGQKTVQRYDGSFLEIIEDFPEQLVKRLSSEMPVWHQEGQILFIHGGLNPNMKFNDFMEKAHEQSYCHPRNFSEDLSPLWIRRPFFANRDHVKEPYKDQNDKDVLVVFGHTRIGAETAQHVFDFNEKEIENWRIAMDNTGAPFMSVLEILNDEATMHVIEKP